MDFAYLKKFMDDMSRERTPGNAIEVYQGGKLRFRYACGYADLESGTPLTGEEYFNIYSCSKVTTVTAALELLEQGKFLLSDPLYEYIPEYRTMYVKTEDGNIVKAQNPITIGSLFNMTAGFSYDTDTKAFQKARELTNGRMDTVTVVKCLAEDTLSFEPGTRWQYSLCHDVLAGVVSVITGMPFREYVKKTIFEPLEMESCCYHRTPEVFAKMASQYSFVSKCEDDSVDLEVHKNCRVSDGAFVNIGKELDHEFGEEYDSGGAGICTTVSDYVKLMAALANYGLGLNGERILAKGTVELMRTNSLDASLLRDFNWEQVRGYGYGLGVRTLMDRIKAGSNGSVGEFGWCGAAGAMALIDPEYDLAVFYAQHTLNPREEYYMPRLRNVIYSCIER